MKQDAGNSRGCGGASERAGCDQCACARAPGRGRSMLLGALVGGVVGVGMLVLPGLAQPDRGQPGGERGGRDRGGERGPGLEPPPGGPEGAPPMSAEELKGRLQRRLEDVRLIERRLEEGLVSLDSGAAPEAVMRELFAPGLRWGMDGGGMRGGPENRGPMTQEERDRLMSVIRERIPGLAESIEQADREQPRLMEAVRARLAPQLREIERMRERDPEGARVRSDELIETIRVMWATRRYRDAVVRSGAASPEVESARVSVREALVAQFDARLAARQHEVEALGQRIESLRADIDSQTAGRDALIDAAMERITQDAATTPAGG